MPKTVVLIPAAGRGTRVGKDLNKILLPLDAQPVILHTLRRVHDHPEIDRVHVIAAPSDYAELERTFRDRERWPKLGCWIEGGPERQDSVRNGIAALEPDPPDWVIVHDAARPLLSTRLLERVLNALRQSAAVVPLVPISDTVRRIRDGISEVLDREQLHRVQTPQGFWWNVLRDAHARAVQSGLRGTDDAQLVEAMGLSLAFVEGEIRNIKLTTGPDFQLGAWIAAHAEWGL